MPKLLEYLGWTFFFYSEFERTHVHVYRKGSSSARSAKIFLEKNGEKDLEWASFGEYKKNKAQIEKVIDEYHDLLITTAKQQMAGKKTKAQKVSKKTKRSKK